MVLNRIIIIKMCIFVHTFNLFCFHLMVERALNQIDSSYFSSFCIYLLEAAFCIPDSDSTECGRLAVSLAPK